MLGIMVLLEFILYGLGGHSGVHVNNVVDKLAKEAVGVK